MAKREKKVIITGVTRESADEAFAAYEGRRTECKNYGRH